MLVAILIVIALAVSGLVLFAILANISKILVDIYNNTISPYFAKIAVLIVALSAFTASLESLPTVLFQFFSLVRGPVTFDDQAGDQFSIDAEVYPTFPVVISVSSSVSVLMASLVPLSIPFFSTQVTIYVFVEVSVDISSI